MRALEQLFEALEGMLPSIIVCAGRFISDQGRDNESFEQSRAHFESLGNIIRDKNLDYLRDHTEWIFIPALDDPGQTHLMPQMPLSNHLLSGFIGAHQGRIKRVTLGTNPLRICFNGKEVVIARYNFMQKLKQNHHPRIDFVQEKVKVKQAKEEGANSKAAASVPASYKVAKTILHQGFLTPLPQIVQPVAWAYAMDTLSIMPQPDFLILADECVDYHHSFDLNDAFSTTNRDEAGADAEMAEDDDEVERKRCEIVNPGNFSHDLSFLALYPNSENESI